MVSVPVCDGTVLGVDEEVRAKEKSEKKCPSTTKGIR